MIDFWLFLEDFLRTALVLGTAIGAVLLLNIWLMRGE